MRRVSSIFKDVTTTPDLIRYMANVTAQRSSRDLINNSTPFRRAL